MAKNLKPLFLVKLFNYEYWPYLLFFLPLVPYWFFLAIRAKSLTFFTAANPGIEHGGIFGESKMEILDMIDKRYLPTSILFEKSSTLKKVTDTLASSELYFPIILKPDVGERGNAVEKIDNVLMLESYLAHIDEDFIAQEYVDFDVELGVLYYKFPNDAGSGITSIVAKEFLSVIGDGVSTLLTLLEQNDRARFQINSLSTKFSLDKVLEKGEYLNLEPIGNHCRGTKFLSGMHLINDDLIKIFDEISHDIEGFNFGRFDLKVKSIEDLMKGENIKILELNGVTSEPGHIYDPKWTLIRAYRDTAANMKVMMQVSLANMKLGVKPTPPTVIRKLLWNHLGPGKS
jgi:hypothetical protein